MLTIAPLKQRSIHYYNDTARAAILASTDRHKAGGGLAEYYSEGETRAPVWVCVGNTEKAAELVGLSAADRAGGQADMDVVARWLDDGIAPNGATGRKFTTRANHGFDLTFCAPKSVSLLRALGDEEVLSKAVIDAHNSAVREALEYLHAHAGYTRVHNPVTGMKDLVRLPGLVMAAYQHETSRAGDPHLHTHVLLPNKQARADGKLVAIDSDSLWHEAKAGGIIYQTTLRRELHQSVGLEWGPIDPRTGMAEVAGVDGETISAWSQRSTQLRQWAAHNLVIDEASGPTGEQLAAAQKATRPAKPEHLSWGDLKRLWASDERGFTLDETTQLDARRQRRSTAVNVLTVARQAAAGIDKAAFTRADLVEAVGARLPVALDGAPGTPRTQIEAIADRIGMRITAHRQAHEREGHERFTAAPVIAEEAAVLGFMGACDQRSVIAEAAVDTARLSADQGRAITNIAVSPWLIQPLSAPAGAGKTTSLKALRAAARRAGNRRVVVLAPTGKAVDVAVREGAGDVGYTVAKAVKDLRAQELTFDARTLVVVDEAGMVGTPDLRELLTATTAAGAKTVLVGDAHQLAPVKARGGMFAQLVEDLPWAQRLCEVWRMRDPAERTVSVAVRNGGPKPLRRAVDWYCTHDRLHTGDSLTMAHDALTNYQADVAAGKDALLMTDSWELSDALNKRIHDATVTADAPTVTAARGHRIAVGDIIISRDNDPTLAVYNAADITKPAGQVRNGQRWRVYAVEAANGRIAARRLGDEARTAFSGDYLREHIAHGYATTIHANQGETAGDNLTAGTAHAVLSERATRALAYVALTRGTHENHVYIYEKTAGEGDHEHAELDEGVHVASRGTSREAVAKLRAIISRDERAHTVMQTAADTDRDQIPPRVAELVARHERTRARLRANHRAYSAARARYDLAADLPALHTEIDFLDAAGRHYAPATGYATHADTLGHLDQAHGQAVNAIAGSLHAVQCLHLYPGADKPAALAALTNAVHRDNHHVLALPATPQATEYAAQHRYADTTSRPERALDKLQTGHWKLPIGSLVIVDDADHLQPGQLHRLADNAAGTNTKLLLITAPDRRQPAHTLTAAADYLLPWAQQLGSPDRSHQRPRSAIERADHHLTTEPPDTRAEYHTASELLQRRAQLLDHFRETANIAAQLDAAAARSHERSRGNDYGLEL
ncbi:MobF family relaxase [Mycobacterium marinum]|uniref:MobF family relaxase n=1 Tax=Mycobacterium marinum TaxID=1781 RepID=UPI003565E39D